MPDEFLRQSEVAQRWGISHRTLERWRWIGQGPRFTKVGGQVRYSVEDIEAYDIEILSGATLVRTLTSVTQSALYASADELADFGAQHGLTHRRGRPRLA